MRLVLVVSVLAAGLMGCETLRSNSSVDISYLNKVKAIEIGASRTDVEIKLGAPTFVAKENEFIRMTYAIAYKSLNVPKAIIWLDDNSRVVSKLVYLYEETKDDMSKAQVEHYFGNIDFKLGNKKLDSKIHYIPSERHFENENAGIFFVTNTSSDKVSEIGWHPVPVGTVNTSN